MTHTYNMFTDKFLYLRRFFNKEIIPGIRVLSCVSTIVALYSISVVALSVVAQICLSKL